jgi:transposase-like protein
MAQALRRDPIYRHRRFSSEIIETCVRWYITYRLSYRDLVALMAERDVIVSHTTIMRWVLRYVPEFEKRWARYAKPVHSSWRMDETAVPVRGGKHYLYRAVDQYGKSVDSQLFESRGREAAGAFFQHAVARDESGWPQKVNVDGNAATHLALRQLGREDRRWRSVTVRSNRYLNNIVEQDHRAIKRRCAAMLAMKSFKTAKIALAGIELAHRIRKGQFSLVHSPRGRSCSLKQQWDLALAPRHRDPRPPVLPDTPSTFAAPELKDRRARSLLTETRIREITRYSRKISDGRGLYLLLAPNGGRYWRYNYRFERSPGRWPWGSIPMCR